MKQYSLFIDGRFISGKRDMIQVINPSTEEIISEVPKATAQDVEDAVDAAARAEVQWKRTPAITRAGYVREIASLVRENADFLAKIIMEEQGKTWNLAHIETSFSADYMDYMAEFARRIEGEVIESDDPNENIFLKKEPIGVAAGILPWNFPFFLIVRKMAPALIAGNTIVIKPSSDTPNNAFEFAKLVAKSHLPNGVFNLISGSGTTVGSGLAGNPKVGIVSMTGSVEVGEKIMEAASRNVTRISLELGGKAPAIVMADADLDMAAKAIYDSRVDNSGQVCNNAERVYVQESVAEEFTKKIVKLMKGTKYGPVADSRDYDMGPLINKKQLENVDEAVQNAIKEGAKLLCGGEPDTQVGGGKGFFYKPTVLSGCRQDMEIMHKETFGPVLPICTFKTMDEAITYSNDCEYGLTSSIFTSNADYMMRACNELEFGETYVNRWNFEAMQGFHQGIKKSGIGGADGKHGFEEYLQSHICYIAYDSAKQ
jgi:lactaldehyde dehydrogenase/glycolaldehyde dehydrogenase